MKEYTYVMIKPDVSGNRDIVEAIKIMLERIDMKIVLTRESEENPRGTLLLDDKILEEHYGHVYLTGLLLQTQHLVDVIVPGLANDYNIFYLDSSS